MDPILRPNPSLFEPWMLWVVLTGAVLVAFIRVSYPRRLPRLFRGILRMQMLRMIMRDEALFSHRASVALYLNFCLSLALVTYLACKYYGILPEVITGFVGYLYLFAGILVVYLLKVILMRFLGWLYLDHGPLNEYTYGVVLTNNAAGLVLLPLGLVLALTNVGNLPTLLLISGIIFLFFILFRYIRGVGIAMSYRVSGLYIISYLCTLEILPIALGLSAVNMAFSA